MYLNELTNAIRFTPISVSANSRDQMRSNSLFHRVSAPVFLSTMLEEGRSLYDITLLLTLTRLIDNVFGLLF